MRFGSTSVGLRVSRGAQLAPPHLQIIISDIDFCIAVRYNYFDKIERWCTYEIIAFYLARRS